MTYYVILNHYSCEDEQTFDSVNLHGKLYRGFEEAKAAANAAMKEEHDNFHHGETHPIETKNCDAFTTRPVYCIGEKSESGFEVYHNLYAVFAMDT